MQNHTMPRPLAVLSDFDAPVAIESEARWARDLPRTCLVFVHGYGGQAVATWGDFPDMAMEHPDFARVDLVFLGYASRSRSADYNKGVLYWALVALAERLSEVLKKVDGPV